VLATSLLICFAAMSFGLDWQPSLAIGMTLSLSSTAIVLQTLNEKGLMKTGAGQSSFSVLLFQDIAVIPMLALFPLLATYSLPEAANGKAEHLWISDLPAWLRTGIVLGSVAAIVVAGKFLVTPFFRIVAASRLRELFTATALLLVVGIAVLMTQVGLSPALGTFVAGVVLANSAYKHELESNLEPFKGLLLGLFFVAVGASMDFSLIASSPGLIFGLVFLLLMIKSFILFLLGRFFGLKLDNNFLFALGLSQGGEFAFVLFSFSGANGILTNDTIDILISVVAISMALTPFLIFFNEKFIQPNVGVKEEVEQRTPDSIQEEKPVIIAGFGHFGNTIGRFLRAHNIGMTILDNDSERVDLLRKLGFKVYYGDASREELLQSAGADKAKLIIIAIEPAEKRLEMIETIKKHFPNLRMLVRAENRYDAYDQMNAGMLHVYRETLDTALRVGVDAMKFLGHRAYTAQRAARSFYRLDEANMKKLASIKDPEEYIVTARSRMEELEKVLQSDAEQFIFSVDKGWDEESLIADAKTEPGA
jgi:monovalent cation:H+ antiporter-2, CPA2 family